MYFLPAEMSPYSARVRSASRLIALLLVGFAGTDRVAYSLDPGKSMTQYAHRIWGQEQGLFQPTVYSIRQTRDGFVWLGTQDSLIRFDGIHFREFADGDSILHGSLVRALEEDESGNLWAASPGNGILRISPDGTTREYSTRNGLPSNSVFCLAAGHSGPDKGAMWACTNEGLVRFEHGRMRVFTTLDGLPSKRIRAACQSADGSLWVAGLDSGLSHWNGSRFAPLSVPEMDSNRGITALACDVRDGIWLGTALGVLHVGRSGVESYSARNGMPDNDVLTLAEDAQGSLWIGTNNGISRLRNREISVYSLRDGLSHSQVLSLCFDREGTLWAGTKNGLDQFTDGNVTPFTTHEGLLSDNVGPLLQDRAGRLWIGTLDRGLNSFDGSRFQAITKRNGLLSNTILSLALDPGGDLWVGTDRGLNRVTKGEVSASYGSASGSLGREIRSVFVDERGPVWVGTPDGLKQLVGGRLVERAPAGNAGRSAVVALSDGRKAPLFVSLDGPGMYLVRDGKIAYEPLASTHPADCFLFDHVRQALWMGTLGSGLLRWKNGSILHVYVRDGLYDNRIYSILRDNSDLWLASSKGIFRLSEKELNDFVDGKSKRVKSLPFSTGQMLFECRGGVQPSAARTSDGRLWFSTTSGLVMLDPSRLRNNRVPPPVVITAVTVNGQSLDRRRQVHLKPDQNSNVEIRFAGLSYINPERVNFRYRLDGHDRAWVYAGDRREAFYSSLPPGDFSFQIEARNADGLWSKKPASLLFIVEPRLYQRWWFFPLLSVIVGLCAVAVIQFRIRRLRQRFTLILAERNRIARELHDTLLQGLSGITMQLQALWTRLPQSREKEFLSEVIKDAALCSAEARQSLWDLRTSGPRNVDFSHKLANLAREVVRGRHIGLELAIHPVSLASRPDTEYQLLRITQEAIANTLKHASALRLTISLEQTGSFLSLIIEDDGFGFIEPERPAGGHFGLQGMRERAAEIGAEILVTSVPNGGTRVSVLLPLEQNFRPMGNSPTLGVHQ